MLKRPPDIPATAWVDEYTPDDRSAAVELYESRRNASYIAPQFAEGRATSAPLATYNPTNNYPQGVPCDEAVSYERPEHVQSELWDATAPRQQLREQVVGGRSDGK